MLLTVKSAAAEDEQAVVALWRACDLVASYNDPVADFRFAKAGPCSDVLVAVDDAVEVVGSVMVGHDGHRGWLYYVAARPTLRGKGVRRRMVQAAENWLRQRGIVKVQLLVRETNTKVVSFYEHLGFEVAPRVVMGRWLGKHSRSMRPLADPARILFEADGKRTGDDRLSPGRQSCVRRNI
jgi:ribosomal protein S18 acetylase RimI-like enzyme